MDAEALDAPPTPPPIVGGAESDVHPEIGVLYATLDGARFAFCTGGLVAPDTVLTAAHCVDGAVEWLEGGATLAFGLGSSLGALRSTAALQAAAVHPGWDPESLSHDIALVRLDAPLPDAPVLALSGAVPTNAQPDTLRVVGFGLTGRDTDDAGVRRMVDLRYDHADLRFLYTWDTAGANLCSGDSGAPALLVGADGRAEAVGVASFVYQTDPEAPLCESGGAGLTRLDTHLAWVEATIGARGADDSLDLSGGGALAEAAPDVGGMTMNTTQSGSNCASAPAPASAGLWVAAAAACALRGRAGAWLALAMATTLGCSGPHHPAPSDVVRAPKGGTVDGGATDGGATNGGTTDGGATDGGATDGGTTDGGTTDGGATDGGATDGGATDGGATDGGATDGGSTPWVRLVSPAHDALVSNPVTFEIEGEGIDTLRIEADGWPLDEWEPTVDGWSTTYTFSGVGYPREIRVQGLDGTGTLVAEDTATITIEPPPGVLLDVPYFYQYDNAYEPGATCGITSTAMVLSAWGVTVDPDTLYVRYGKAQGQSPTGILAMYEWEGLEGEAGWSASRAELRALLDAGQPVIVHGWWTSAGHIVVLIGYDDTGWLVNDPAGDWDVCYGCGHGEGVHYAFGSAWDVALGADGDIWWSSAHR